MTTRIPVYILAGGESSRFGSDKARAEVHGKPLIVHLADALRPVASSLTVVAQAPGKYDDLGLPAIGDVIPGLGPLGGLYTAVDQDACEGWLLLTSCDWLGIQARWVERLLANVRAGAQVVAFRGVGWEPLLALYHTSIRETLREHVSRRKLALWELIERVERIALPLPEDWRQAVQINSRLDLREYLKRSGRASLAPTDSEPG